MNATRANVGGTGAETGAVLGFLAGFFSALLQRGRNLASG